MARFRCLKRSYQPCNFCGRNKGEETILIQYPDDPKKTYAPNNNQLLVCWGCLQLASEVVAGTKEDQMRDRQRQGPQRKRDRVKPPKPTNKKSKD